GAKVTDLVVLVVAADDSIMPQTQEAIDHARAAEVPIIVAVNKIDKPGAQPDKVMKGLSEIGILSEAWGGENIFVNVSATKKTGIKELLEAIVLQAEVLDMKANPERPGEGSVLEARLDRSRGAVVDVLVKRGTLRVGDAIVAGPYYGRVRALTDDKGRALKELAPGYAAELLGLEGVPVAGDEFNVMKTDAEARELAEQRYLKAKGADTNRTKITLEEIFAKVQQGDMKELPILLKTDVFGSTEALRESLTRLSTDQVKVKILSASTGGISESDIMLASASNAIVLGFNVRPETKARLLAENEGVEIKCYSIIYELLDEVKKAMTGLLDKKAVEKYLGRAEVRELFSVPKIGNVAGCSVVDGKIIRTASVRLLRDNRVIFTGKLSSLRRFKDDAKEVAQGYECGIGIENYNDIKQGDVIEAFAIEMVAHELGAPSAPKGAAEPAQAKA
ncbi:MAG: translation initiation factor IF-2, partial [Deltaproteobacteria bacterium]|nr:translation initiation factor IF-2 [Deltaproteobacteria bacterium]